MCYNFVSFNQIHYKHKKLDYVTLLLQIYALFSHGGEKSKRGNQTPLLPRISGYKVAIIVEMEIILHYVTSE